MKKFTTIFFIITLVILTVLLIFLYANENPKTNTIEIKIKNQTFVLEKAVSSEEKAKGLMYVKQLEENKGMIFIFEDEQPRTFWMKNTLIPLDIIFLDENKKIVDINHNFQPCDEELCETYTSKPAMYVIEINAGLSEKLNLSEGEIIEVD